MTRTASGRNVPTTCNFCGKALPERKAGQRGRIRYEHDRCRMARTRLEQALALCEGIDFADNAHRAKVRARFWSGSNSALNPHMGKGGQQYRDQGTEDSKARKGRN